MVIDLLARLGGIVGDNEKVAELVGVAESLEPGVGSLAGAVSGLDDDDRVSAQVDWVGWFREYPALGGMCVEIVL